MVLLKRLPKASACLHVVQMRLSVAIAVAE